MSRSIIRFLTLYLPATPYVFIYMLQQVEYDSGQFLSWANRLPDYRRVIRRKKLVRTKKALSLLGLAYCFYFAALIGGLWLAVNGKIMFAVFALAWVPVGLVLFLTALVALGDNFLKLKRGKDLQRAHEAMSKHKAIKIAVLGSYGKTTVKELLATVLAEGKRVAITPGNRNVAISHARWINETLTGDEDIIVFEYGEYRPGDIAELAWLTQPNYAIITGFAPNHIDTYKSVQALKADLASIQEFVPAENLFASDQSAHSLALQLDSNQVFSNNQVLGWQVTVQRNDFDGLQIVLKKGKQSLSIKSGLLGRHLAAPVAFVAAFARELGLSKADVIAGVSKTTPFKHRLKASQVSGAWLIDDTYNGNIEGIKAGLALLEELPGKRKIYVTPGLVEQGTEKEQVHKEIAQHILATAPDEVVLMRNSATAIIAQELQNHDFAGSLQVEENPLAYYESLPYKISIGDVVLMQNDWTDNYN